MKKLQCGLGTDFQIPAAVESKLRYKPVENYPQVVKTPYSRAVEKRIILSGE